MPGYSKPNAVLMASQFHNHSVQFAGVTATIWSYVSASGGASVAGFGDTVYSAGRTITAQFYVARGFLIGVQQVQTPAGMMPVGDGLMNSEYKPSVDDVIVYQGVRYRIEGEPQLEPLLKQNWVTNLKRAGA